MGDHEFGRDKEREAAGKAFGVSTGVFHTPSLTRFPLFRPDRQAMA